MKGLFPNKEMRTAYKHFARISERKRSGHRWEDNVTNSYTDSAYIYFLIYA
jgi:hypothetical protein